MESRRSYQIIEPSGLDGAIRQADGTTLALLTWLIQLLSVELEDQLGGVELAVICVSSHHPNNRYLALGSHYPGDNAVTTDKGPLIEATVDRLLQERPLGEFMAFLNANATNWHVAAAQLLQNVTP